MCIVVKESMFIGRLLLSVAMLVLFGLVVYMGVQYSKQPEFIVEDTEVIYFEDFEEGVVQ